MVSRKHRSGFLGDFQVIFSSRSLCEFASTTINLTSTNVVASGNVNVGTLQKNDLASGARVELVDDATDPAIVQQPVSSVACATGVRVCRV